MKKSKSASSTAESPPPAAGYSGRFAPSPTGPLHWGSLFTATVSYLDARASSGRWLLRIDDLDGPRSEPGSEDAILKSLDAHALHWDGAVDHQSNHLDRYQAALVELEKASFYCRCSRRSIAGRPYPGTCRNQREPLSDAAIRVRVDAAPIGFEDRFAGPQRADLLAQSGDFVIRRRDGLIAYQLATAVDDGDPAINEIVRGRDLLESTARQLWLMDLLGLERPRYGHVPVIVDHRGNKLSKQHGAPAIRDATATDNLQRVLRTLGLLTAEDNRQPAGPEDLLALGIERWRAASPELARLLGRGTLTQGQLASDSAASSSE